eukprot:gene1181-1518_t
MGLNSIDAFTPLGPNAFTLSSCDNKNVRPVRVAGIRRAWNAAGTPYKGTEGAEWAKSAFGRVATFLGATVATSKDITCTGVVYDVTQDEYNKLVEREKSAGYLVEVLAVDSVTFLDGKPAPPSNARIAFFASDPKTLKLPSSRSPMVMSYVDIWLIGALQLQRQFNLSGPAYQAASGGKHFSFANETVATTYDWSPNWWNDRPFPLRPWVTNADAVTIDQGRPWGSGTLQCDARAVKAQGGKLYLKPSSEQERLEISADLVAASSASNCSGGSLRKVIADVAPCVVYDVPGTNEGLLEGAVPMLRQIMQLGCEKAAAAIEADSKECFGYQDKQLLLQLSKELGEEWDPDDPAKSMLSEEPFLSLLSCMIDRPIMLIDVAGASAVHSGGFGGAFVKLYIPESLNWHVQQLSGQLSVLQLSEVPCLLYTASHFDVALFQQHAVMAMNTDSHICYAGDETAALSFVSGVLCSPAYGEKLVSTSGATGAGAVLADGGGYVKGVGTAVQPESGAALTEAVVTPPSAVSEAASAAVDCARQPRISKACGKRAAMATPCVGRSGEWRMGSSAEMANSPGLTRAKGLRSQRLAVAVGLSRIPMRPGPEYIAKWCRRLPMLLSKMKQLESAVLQAVQGLQSLQLVVRANLLGKLMCLGPITVEVDYQWKECNGEGNQIVIDGTEGDEAGATLDVEMADAADVLQEMATFVAATGTGRKGGKKGGTGVSGSQAKHVPVLAAMKTVVPGQGLAGAAVCAMAANTGAALARSQVTPGMTCSQPRPALQPKIAGKLTTR